MTIPSPNLDDRDFETLMQRALELVRSRQSSWNDLSPSDPGVVLLEAFAYLTDVLIYRLNRVPEKARREFLQLLNFSVGPPSAAAVAVVFSADGLSETVSLEAGAVVTAADEAGGEPISFITDAPVTLGPDNVEQMVIARHCSEAVAELLGVSTGEPGQRYRLDLMGAA